MASSEKTRVFIIDDHPVVRQGLAQFIDAQDGLIVCGEAADASSALAALNGAEAQVAIVDISLEETDGIELIRAVRSRHPGIRIVVLSMHTESGIVKSAVNAGAMGYVTKGEKVTGVLDAIAAVLRGDTYLSPRLAEKLLKTMLWEEKRDDIASVLSPREMEIFRLVGQGLNSSQISLQLNVSLSTVGTHREQIKKKLNIGSAAELVRIAIEWHIRNKEDSINSR